MAARARTGFTERLAHGAAARPRRALALWGVAVVVALASAATTLGGLSSDGKVTGSPESTRAANLIAQAFPPTAADLRRQTSDVIVVSSDRYPASSPQFHARVSSLVARLRATSSVLSVHSDLSRASGLVSRDGHATLIQLFVASDSGIKPVVSLVRQADRAPGFAVSMTGEHTVANDFNALSQRDLERGELVVGLPAALIVLLLVFGAVVAGLVPLLMAVVSIVVGLGILALLSLEFSLSVFVVNMLTAMGLALGIDYSLFVISRYREERSHGSVKKVAIASAGATASRAVLFSGGTFAAALLGMMLVPTTIMRSLAAGAIVVGVVSVAAALTLLPALLSLLGDRVDALRVPLIGRNLGRADAAEGRFWSRIVALVLRRPLLSLALSAGLMLAAAAPVFGLHIGASGVSTLPNSVMSKQGYLALQREFPVQAPSPAQIVVRGGDPSARADVVRLRDRLARDPRFGPGSIQPSPTSANTWMLSVPVRGDEVGGPAVAAVRDLRARVVPSVFAGSGAQVLVGGKTAQNADYFDAVTNPTPFVLVFVLGLSFLVLMVAFRSLVVAAVSILLNLLSVGAAYGLLTLVFLKGVGAGLLGFQQASSIDAWVPLFLFSVLFGLSMDYQVFLMSRIKERYDTSGSTRDAVAWGVASTARIITGAAAIIVVVFAGFARGELVMFQQMGFGIGVALLLDATLIRSVVLPSAMALLSGRSWYLPRWLGWLPHLEIEPRRALQPESGTEAV
jgi:uncharacterized membrane protein YdfJ with MMPL/SSD domain